MKIILDEQPEWQQIFKYLYISYQQIEKNDLPKVCLDMPEWKLISPGHKVGNLSSILSDYISSNYEFTTRGIYIVTTCYQTSFPH